MKAKISLAAIVLAGFILFAACGTTSSSTKTSSSSSSSSSSTASMGYNSGTQAGSSLLFLFNQYKSTKKINFGDFSTLGQLLNLAGSVQQIKANSKDKNFYSQFAIGMVSGSKNVVTNSTANSVITTLLTGLDLTGISAGNNNVPASTQNTVLSGLTGLFSLFGK